MCMGDGPAVEDVLAGFDEHLRRTRGVCPGTRRNYARFVRAFLQAVSADGGVEAAGVCVRDVFDCVGAATRRYQAGTVELAASALRSFFRFLRAAGLRSDRMEDAVPMVPHRRAGLPRHLDPARFEQLIASLDSSSPRGLRDRAIILCMARLGLRASEVTRLRLEDIDWREAVVRVRTRQTGHSPLLPPPGAGRGAPGPLALPRHPGPKRCTNLDHRHLPERKPGDLQSCDWEDQTGRMRDKRRTTPLVPLLATGWSHAHGGKPLNLVPCRWRMTPRTQSSVFDGPHDAALGQAGPSV